MSTNLLELINNNPNVSLLTNFEVMQILKNTKDVKKKTGLRNLATISYETLQYLENTTCMNQTKDNVISFLDQIKSYKLTKSECMMMINNPPSSQLHIQLLIEDSEERLTEPDVQNILQIVSQTLLITQ